MGGILQNYNWNIGSRLQLHCSIILRCSVLWFFHDTDCFLKQNSRNSQLFTSVPRDFVPRECLEFTNRRPINIPRQILSSSGSTADAYLVSEQDIRLYVVTDLGPQSFTPKKTAIDGEMVSEVPGITWPRPLPTVNSRQLEH